MLTSFLQGFVPALLGALIVVIVNKPKKTSWITDFCWATVIAVILTALDYFLSRQQWSDSRVYATGAAVGYFIAMRINRISK